MKKQIIINGCHDCPLAAIRTPGKHAKVVCEAAGAKTGNPVLGPLFSEPGKLAKYTPPAWCPLDDMKPRKPKCQHCGTKFSDEEIWDGANGCNFPIEEGDQKTFNCPECGGELCFIAVARREWVPVGEDSNQCHHRGMR